MDEKIKMSYEKITPTDLKKKEMLLKIQNSEEVNAKSNGFSFIRKEFYMKKFVSAAVIALCVLTVSTGVYATYRWLSSEQVVSEMGDKKLAKYFNKSEDEIQVQEKGNYKAVFLGTVSGKDISETCGDETVNKKISYFVTAVEHKDGTPFEDIFEVVVSPLVKGVNPMEFNIYSMDDSGAQAIEKDGIVYLLTQCYDVEMFADRGVYLAVMDGPNMGQGYHFNDETGEITRNEDFDRLNLLFELSLEQSKADPEVAQKYLDKVREELNDSDDEEQNNEEQEETKGPWDDLENPEEVLEKATYVEGTKQQLEPDQNGGLIYHTEDGQFASTTTYLKEHKIQTVHLYDDDENEDEIIVFQYENGKYFASVYTCDKSITRKNEIKRIQGEEVE